MLNVDAIVDNSNFRLIRAVALHHSIDSIRFHRFTLDRTNRSKGMGGGALGAAAAAVVVSIVNPPDGERARKTKRGPLTHHRPGHV